MSRHWKDFFCWSFLEESCRKLPNKTTLGLLFELFVLDSPQKQVIDSLKTTLSSKLFKHLFYSCHLFCVCRQCKQHSLSDCMVPQRSESLRWKIKALVSFHPTTNLCWNENNENPTSALDWIWIESVKFLGSWLYGYGFVWCWFWGLRMIFCWVLWGRNKQKHELFAVEDMESRTDRWTCSELQLPIQKMEDII